MSSEILIVEDDEPIRTTLRYLLEQENFIVVEAANGAEALSFLKTTKNEPCLILLDLMMPVMTGIEFLEIRKRCKKIAHIPVVIVSAISTTGRLGVLDHEIPFIKKPIDLCALMKWVHQECTPSGLQNK